MELTWTEDQLAFRRRVIDFLDKTLPTDWEEIQRHGPGSREITDFSMHFCPKLAEAGLLVPHWPVEFGGNGGAPWEHFIVGEELWAIGEPRGGQYMNINWIGPTLMKFGNAEQKAAYIPPMAEGTVLWCQGFSEPGAGSDLASLRTRAELDGADYVINGQKIWTSYASHAKHCFLLARTSDDKRAGISIFLINMDTPGISVRPIPSLLGDGDIHEMFFTDMRVPASSMLGTPGEAWSIITYALANERVGIARYELSRRMLERAVTGLEAAGSFGGCSVRQAAAEAMAACEAARCLVYRIVDERARGMPPSSESSVARWAVITADHKVQNFVLEYAPDLLLKDGDPIAFSHHERAIASGVAAGAAEIQLGIVATQYLNLPREVR